MNYQDYQTVNSEPGTIAAGYPKGQSGTAREFAAAGLDVAASIQDRLAPLVEQADAIVGRLMAVLDEPVLPMQGTAPTFGAGPPPHPGCHAQVSHLEDALSRIGTKVAMVQSRVGRL